MNLRRLELMLFTRTRQKIVSVVPTRQTSTTSFTALKCVFTTRYDNYSCYNGVGSCSLLGRTVHYQDTISMENITFLCLWSDIKNWEAQAPGCLPGPCPPLFFYTYNLTCYKLKLLSYVATKCMIAIVICLNKACMYALHASINQFHCE